MQAHIEGFLQFLAIEKGYSEHTVAAYRNDLFQFLRYLIGRGFLSWQDVNQRHVWDYILYLEGRGYAPSTVHRKAAAVRSYFSFLVADGVLAEDPAGKVSVPRVEKRLPRPLSVVEVASLLAEASRSSAPKGLRDWALLELMCATGMRASEVIQLKVDALDLEAGTVRCVGRESAERVVPLRGRAREVLRAYLGKGRPQLLRDKGESALFLNSRGRALTRQGLWLIVRKHAAAAGIEREVTPHTLRHSFAVHVLDRGAGLEELRQLLGHTNLSSTRIYTQISARHK